MVWTHVLIGGEILDTRIKRAQPTYSALNALAVHVLTDKGVKGSHGYLY